MSSGVLRFEIKRRYARARGAFQDGHGAPIMHFQMLDRGIPTFDKDPPTTHPTHILYKLRQPEETPSPLPRKH